MAEPRIYKDDELPIPVPPVNRAWDDMLQRLEAGAHRKPFILPKLVCTTLLLLSWLVIRDNKMHTGSGAPRQEISAQTISPRISEKEMTQPLDTDDQIGQEPQASIHTSNPKPDRPYQRQAARKHRKATRRNLAGAQDPVQELTAPEPPRAINNTTTDPVPGRENPAQQNAQTDSTAQKKPLVTDTSSALEEKLSEEKKTDEDKWQLHGGLHWEAQVPTTGLYGYLDGVNQTAAPWRVLVPGLFLEAIQDKNALNVTVMPMFSQSVTQTPFRTVNSLPQNADTTISREEVKSMYKLLGLSASLGYARNLHEQWWGGLSLQAAWWQQGLAVSDVRDTYIVQGQTVQSKAYSYTYKVSEEWSYFSRMQMFLNADLAYRKPAWQAGIRAGVALTPLSKGNGPGHMFRGAVFLRWTPFKRSPAR